MRRALFALLIYASPVFAEEPQQPAAYQSRTHECHGDKGFERRIELRYKTPEAPLPCRVVWFRGDYENSKIEHVLVDAKHQAGKCEEKEAAYLEKMKSWKVSCELVARQVAGINLGPAPTPPPALLPAATLAPKPADIFKTDFAGAYFGLVLGMQSGKSRDKTGSFGYNADDDKWDYDTKGFDAALEFGMNYENNGLVFGPEIEWGYLGAKGDGAQPNSPAGDTSGQIQSNIYMALRGRAGIDFDHYMIFLAGGLMGVNAKTEIVDNCNVAPCGGTTVDADKSAFDWGYTVGVGGEHLLENGRTSIKLEYLYYNLGDRKFDGTTSLGNTYEWTSKSTGSIIRAGLNRHF